MDQSRESKDDKLDVADLGDAERQSIEGETAHVLDHQAERALCRKFDVRLMPVLAVMCKCENARRVPSSFDYHSTSMANLPFPCRPLQRARQG